MILVSLESRLWTVNYRLLKGSRQIADGKGQSQCVIDLSFNCIDLNTVFTRRHWGRPCGCTVELGFCFCIGDEWKYLSNIKNYSRFKTKQKFLFQMELHSSGSNSLFNLRVGFQWDKLYLSNHDKVTLFLNHYKYRRPFV